MGVLRRVGTIRATGARFMSGHSIEEAVAETKKWQVISYGFIPFVVLVTCYVMGTHKHSHYHKVDYQFIKKRDKEMPWALKGGSKCDLFDYTCAAKEKAAKAALERAWESPSLSTTWQCTLIRVL